MLCSITDNESRLLDASSWRIWELKYGFFFVVYKNYTKLQSSSLLFFFLTKALLSVFLFVHRHSNGLISLLIYYHMFG
jgi:hypothetical protein